MRPRNRPALHEPQEVLCMMLEDESGVRSIIVDRQTDIWTERYVFLEPGCPMVTGGINSLDSIADAIRAAGI